MRSPADLTVAAHTLDPAPLEQRPTLARLGGFGGLGLSVSQVGRWLAAGNRPAALRAELDRQRMPVTELEALVAAPRADPEREDLAFELVRTLQVPHLLAIPPRQGTRAQIAEGLRRITERAGELGADVALEPLPWTALPVPGAEAAELARSAGAGLCLDVWHVFRHGGRLADLADCRSQISEIQLSDGVHRPEVDDPLADCLDHRLPPGAGRFPLREVIAAAPAARLSVEVLSRRLRERPVRSAVAEIGAAARALVKEPCIGRTT